MGNRIDGISAFRIRMPLTRPYHLSLVTLDHFDSILVRIQADGKEGFGETTDIPGYFHETPEDAWDFIERWGPKLLNKGHALAHGTGGMAGREERSTSGGNPPPSFGHRSG
ncbi:MAG: hypothetical protein JRJ82_09385 [Deltaproteobacteria bacterium]|nr:hypothetical protein [Deltaproteobacteria bacterium]